MIEDREREVARVCDSRGGRDEDGISDGIGKVRALRDVELLVEWIEVRLNAVPILRVRKPDRRLIQRARRPSCAAVRRHPHARHPRLLANQPAALKLAQRHGRGLTAKSKTEDPDTLARAALGVLRARKAAEQTGR